jgi:hypothetical protein
MNESFPHAVLRLMGAVAAGTLTESKAWRPIFLTAAAAAYTPNQGPFRLAGVDNIDEKLLQSLHADAEALLYQDIRLTVWCTPFMLVVHRPNLSNGFTLVGLVGRTVPKDHEALINNVMRSILNAP